MMGPVTQTADRALVWLRALLLATVALVAGSVAHAGAHGVLPPPPVLLALLAVGTTVVAPLLRRPAGTGRIVLLLVVGQAAVHAALTASAATATTRRRRTRGPARPCGSPAWPRTSPRTTP